MPDQIEVLAHLSDRVLASRARQSVEPSVSPSRSDRSNARHLAILTSCDTTLTLVAKDELGAKAARAVARVLARLTEGHLTDPQTGVTTRPSDETP